MGINKKKEGVVIVRGTSSTNSIVKLLPHIAENGPNVKIVSAISWGLFQRQTDSYRKSIISENELADLMIITNGAKRLMHKWSTNKMVDDYSISSDWDNRWRTGGSLNEIISEAHLDPNNILKGIELFAKNRQKRLSQLISEIPKS